jgi:two-component system, NarL family, nitrate/nitrite response regulator NarL
MKYAKANSSNAGGGCLRLRAGHRIRVLIADDHPVARRGIASWLKQRANMEVVGEARDGEEALRKARELLPDVLVADICMPHRTGLEVAQALQKELPNIRVLLLSMHTDRSYVLSCVQSGARGYILKEAGADELVQAIETVNAGHSSFSPVIAEILFKQFDRGNGQGEPALSNLTRREREVLIGIAEGLTSKEIANRLNMSIRTVETHRERLMNKLDIRSVAGLTRFAVARGLVKVPEPSAA